MIKKLILPILAFILVSGCAFTPHDVEMKARASDTESRIDESRKLGLRVLDNRPSSRVGQRGHMNLGSSITATNAADNLESELRKFYSSMGFEVVDYNDRSASSRLEAALRGLELFVESDFPIGTISDVNVAIRVDAESQSKSYANIYRSSAEKKSFAAPTGEAITNYLSDGLSEALRNMANDEELQEVLEGD